MQSVDPHPRFHIEKQFPERHIIDVLKILGKFFGFKDETVLDKIGDDHQYNVNTADEVPVDR
jgi:hypothetical protein